MPRLSSTQTGTDIRVEPKLLSKPVSEMSDAELLAELERLRGARGTTTTGERAPRKASTTKVEKWDDVDELG